MSDDLDKLLETMFQAHPWHGVDPGDPAGVVQAFIEIAPTDTVKYELDKRSGHLKVDRPQRYSSQPPTLYGFIPQTYCGKRVGERCSERTGVPGVKGDGDPMDVCILTEKTMAHANFFLRARPIGGLRMVDGEEADDKIVAVLERDMAYGDLRDIADAPPGSSTSTCALRLGTLSSSLIFPSLKRHGTRSPCPCARSSPASSPGRGSRSDTATTSTATSYARSPSIP